MDFIDELFDQDEQEGEQQDQADSLPIDAAVSKPQTLPQQEAAASNLSQAEKEKKALQEACPHNELFRRMCLKCTKVLTLSDISQSIDSAYREYGLLGRGRGFMIKESQAPIFIKNKVEELIQQERLVLVLDLDNTLIHTKEIRQQGPLPKKDFIRPEKWFPALYQVFVHPWRYMVKLRPFICDFFKDLLPKFRIFFYTAGVSKYGATILKVIKEHLEEHASGFASPEEKDRFLGLVNGTFKEERLIGRDDQSRFEAENSFRHQANPMGGGGGGDATLQMKSVYKSLKALAGNNDRIFAILDDRSDPWETKTSFIDQNGVTRQHREIPANLIQIPAYFFHLSRDAESLQGVVRFNTIQTNLSDLDLGLLTSRDFLLKVHSKFFADLKGKPLDSCHSGEFGDIKKYLNEARQQVFSNKKVVNFLSFVSWQKHVHKTQIKDPETGQKQLKEEEKTETVIPRYERHLCATFGLPFEMHYSQAMTFDKAWEDKDLKPNFDRVKTSTEVSEPWTSVFLVGDAMKKEALDNVTGKLKQLEKALGNEVVAVSIYWLYISAFLWKEMPIELFKDIKVQNKEVPKPQGEDDTKGQSPAVKPEEVMEKEVDKNEPSQTPEAGEAGEGADQAGADAPDEVIIEQFLAKVTLQSEAKRIFSLMINSFRQMYPEEWKTYKAALPQIGDQAAALQQKKKSMRKQTYERILKDMEGDEARAAEAMQQSLSSLESWTDEEIRLYFKPLNTKRQRKE